MPGTPNSPISPLRGWLVAFVMMATLVATPLTALAQTEVPAAEPVAQQAEPTEAPPPAEPTAAESAPEEQVQQVQQAPAPPPTGSLEIRLTGTNGVGLSGLFAVTDAAGAYHERWAEGGGAWFPELVVGTATISQLSGTTDYAFDGSTPSYIDVPAGGHAVLPIVNAFLDADGDGFGDSIDICGAGSDAVDTDADGVPDACDATPNGDDDADGVDNAVDACPAGDDAVDTDADGVADACDETPDGDVPAEQDETSTVVAEVAPEPMVVEGATVSCDQLAGLTPAIASDLAEYAPGAVVTLTGTGWAPGQVVKIDVDDDGKVDAAVGEWSHTADVTADDTGTFSHQLTLPEPVVASYRVVATGQCSDVPAEMSEIVAEVAAEPVVVEEAPVTCQQADAVAPWIATDLADYPPGSRVTLTGGNWVAGQTIEILVEDDDIADTERGPWSHAATVTADTQGAFTYQFDLAPWFVADYSVVATGECREARTSFTDTIQLSASLSPIQVPTSSSTAFSMTITNTTTSPDNTVANNLGCVRITIPSGYTAVAASATSASAGKSWSVQSVSSTLIVLAAGGEPSRLAVNEQVTVQFNATTPSGTGSSNFAATGRTAISSACTAGGAAFNTQNIGVTRIDNKFRAAATVNPTSVSASTSQTFTVRITNNGGGGGDALGSAKILIPAGFSTPTALSFSGSGFISGTPTWSTIYNSGEGKIRVDSGNSNNRINPGGYIEVTFTVTGPSTAGPRTFTAEAWKDNGFNSDVYGFTSQPVVTVTAPTVACTPTVSLNGADLDFGTSTWSGAAFPTSTGGLAIQISATGTGCSGFPTSWSVQASTSDMNRTGGGTIPATAISYTGTGSGSPPTDLTPSGATSLGGTSQVIATGNATTATGTWNAGFSLAPPVTSTPGAYTGTITITAAAGS